MNPRLRCWWRECKSLLQVPPQLVGELASATRVSSTSPCGNKGVSVSLGGVSFRQVGSLFRQDILPRDSGSYCAQHRALLHLAWAPRLHCRSRWDRSSLKRRWASMQAPVQASPPAARAARPPRLYLQLRDRQIPRAEAKTQHTSVGATIESNQQSNRTWGFKHVQVIQSDLDQEQFD